MAEKMNPFATDESGNSLKAKEPIESEEPTSDTKASSPEDAVSQALTEAGTDAGAFLAKLKELGYDVVKKGGKKEGPKSMADSRNSAIDMFMK